MHAVEQDAHPLFLLAQPLGLVVHLGVERDDAAVRLLHLGLQLQQSASEPAFSSASSAVSTSGGFGNAVAVAACGCDGERRQRQRGEQEGKRPCRLRHRQPIDLAAQFPMRAERAVRSSPAPRSTLMINCSSLAGPAEITVSAAPQSRTTGARLLARPPKTLGLSPIEAQLFRQAPDRPAERTRSSGSPPTRDS